MSQLDAQYWEKRYQASDTPWNIGYPSPALVRFFQSLPHKDLRILIPGAGYAHEAEWLWRAGFRHVFVCDWAASAFCHLRKRVPQFPDQHLFISDFFALTPAYDLIVEQTFFCALPPQRRPDYVRQCAHLLSPRGILAGLLFAQPFPFEGPPFGGTLQEYRALFKPFFHIEQMHVCPHSIKPRQERELFFLAKKRQL